MDNDQVVDQVVPEGETTPTEQSPTVQSDGATSQGEEAPKGTTFQELAAKKGWKSPDDMAKSYREIESHSTKVSQKASDLEKEFFNREPSAPSQQMPDDAALQELDKFVNERVKKEVQAIRSEWQDREARRELREVMDKNQDFGKYAKDVKELKTQYPNMSFGDALLFAKAQKGDLQSEATSKAMQTKTEAVVKQMAAQVTTPKQGKESPVGAQDMLQGASKRWAPKTYAAPDQRAVSEIEQIEKELFGRVLVKTNSGL